MGALAPGHLIILVAVLLLVFGAKRLPEIGRGVGHGMRELKDSLSGESSAPAEGPTPAEVVAARQTTPTPAAEIARAEGAEPG